MTLHHLNNWKQYLTNDDYNYLIQFVENIKNNIHNDKMIILSGPSRSGKSTLKNDIQQYLSDVICGPMMMSGEIIYNENIKKLGLFSGIDEIRNSKKTNTAIINLIKYKQSLLADTNNIERVNNKLLEFSKIIKMEHVFYTVEDFNPHSG
jgi:ABC-type phosphate/phosphonate transport system ATPase subunit